MAPPSISGTRELGAHYESLPVTCPISQLHLDHIRPILNRFRLCTDVFFRAKRVLYYTAL